MDCIAKAYQDFKEYKAHHPNPKVTQGDDNVFFKTILTDFSNDKVSVYMVDGSTIRDPLTKPYCLDFTEGDNDMHNPKLVPPGQIYIDLDVAPTEVRPVIIHEATERRAMIEMKSKPGDPDNYSTAHNDFADPAEEYARKHREKLDELVQAELAIAPAFPFKKDTEAPVMKTNLIKKSFVFQTKQITDNMPDHCIEFDGSLETPDRMGDRVHVEGWQLDNYQKNPVFMWQHDYSQPPIGKTLKTWTDNGKLKFIVQFADKDTYDFADTIYRLYKGGFMNAVSVGFAPIDCKPYEDGETKGIDYNKQELLELSAVPIPAHQDALASARSQGVITVKELQQIVPAPKQYSQAQLSDIIDELKCAVANVGLSDNNLIELRRLTGSDTPVEIKHIETSEVQERINRILGK